MPTFRYFPTPTPGQPNNAGVEILGPIIADADHSPADCRPSATTCRSPPGSRPASLRVASAQLHYRVMFDAEVTIPLLDDGNSGDGAAGDGVYGARIPASARSSAGQMVRWYITATDTAGRDVAVPDLPRSAELPAVLTARWSRTRA